MFGLLTIGQIEAQSRTVKGKVTDVDTNEGIPGVSVSVKGTTSGTTTDVEGNFELSVADGAVLIFQGVGLALQEVAVGAQSTLSVSMKSESKQLGEVVVVGYGGIQDRKDLTGVVGTVKGADVANLPVQSFEQALQGRIAGVNITTPNGVLGNPPVIRVRGTNSISSGAQPLIVIDGLPIFSGQASNGTFTVNNPLGDISPNDIESYEVLKDASATAIYGSRAANGVILITTRKGKKGKTQVEYNTWVGYTESFRRFNLLDAQQFMDIKNEARRNQSGPTAANIANPTFNPDGSLVNTNWYDQVYRTGFQQSHQLNVGGGTDKTKYYFSLGYTDQDGMLVQNKFRRFTGRFNMSHEVNKWLSVGTNVQLTNSFNQSPNTGSRGAFGIGGLGRLPLVLPPNVRVRNLDGTYNIEAGNRIGRGNNTQPSGSFYNPLPDQELSKFTSQNNRIIANAYADFSLLKGLNFRTTLGIDNLNIEDVDFRNAIHGEGQTLNGLASNVYSKSSTWNWQNTLTYNRTFAEKHTIDVLLGTEYQKSTFNAWGGSRQNVSDLFFSSYEGTFSTNNPPPVAISENALESYFGRINYSFMGKYLFTANLRRDGYSALSKNNKFGDFGGVSVGWRISDENFFKNTSALSFVDDFKIRGSWGRVGNVNIADFASLNLFSGSVYGASASSWAYSQAGNANLKWESSTKTDVGFDASFFKGKLQVGFSYYRNDIDNLIINDPMPPSLGIPASSIARNVGSMRNNGIELTVTSTNIKKGDFEWTTDFNFTTNKNVVTSLNESGADIPGVTGGLEQTNLTRVGEPVGSLFAVRTAGVNPANGRAMFVNAAGRIVQYDHSAPAASRWTFVDDGSIASSPAGDRVLAGNTNPTWFGGIGNTIRYKGIDFNIFLQFSGGNYIYNGTRAGLLDQRMWNNSTEILQRWTTPGQVTNIPRVVFNDNFSNGSAFPITRNIERGDFMRIRNITLGYTIPSTVLKGIGVDRIRIYAQVQNALVFTNYTGADPEISTNGAANLTPGVDRNSTPQARTYTFGMNVNF